MKKQEPNTTRGEILTIEKEKILKSKVSKARQKIIKLTDIRNKKEESGFLSKDDEDIFQLKIKTIFDEIGKIEKVILTKDELKKLPWKSLPVVRMQSKITSNEDLNELVESILYPENKKKSLDTIRKIEESVLSLIQGKELKRRVGIAIAEAYQLGQDVMLERLMPYIPLPPGANAEANKPFRLKYGKMYHDRIVYNVNEKFLKERATKDNPVTAKSEAVKYINDILEKAGEKKRGMKCLDGWREEYQLDRTMRNGNN